MSLIRIEKSPFSWLRKSDGSLTLQPTTQNSKNERQNRKQSTKKQKQETFPLISSGSLQWVKASENNNLHTKFLLQFLKQWEDSPMLLASNKQQHNEIAKNRKTKQGKTSCTEKDSREEQRPSGLTRSSPLIESLKKLQMLKFHKRIFHYWATL